MARLSVKENLVESCNALGWSFSGMRVLRTSSRFCLGVEHGDYNGTELFGVGTDRFIWIACKPNGLGRIRILSDNFKEDGLVEIDLSAPPSSGELKDSWARFPAGVVTILRDRDYELSTGFDAVLYGNIPGGGMSRSASLSINLILALAEFNDLKFPRSMAVPKLAQAVENEYIGSPCGILDQVMIFFAREGMGTRFDPKTETVEHIALGADAEPFSLVSLDTGTVRHGLEKSTYSIRRAECERLVELAGQGFGFSSLADIKTEEQYLAILAAFQETAPDLCSRLKYIFSAQNRFDEMLNAWKRGDILRLGALFRADGLGLRDDYVISGPELETMCTIARTVPGVYGERMLGGGDKGASGAIVRADSVDVLKRAVDLAYPRSYPHLAGQYAVHPCRLVDGVVWDPEDCI